MILLGILICISLACAIGWFAGWHSGLEDGFNQGLADFQSARTCAICGEPLIVSCSADCSDTRGGFAP